MIEEMKVKYKRRIEEQNNKIEEINILNEKSRKEIAVLQKESSESRSKYDAAVVQHKNDLKYVKDEWERKCQNFALQSQNELVSLFSTKSYKLLVDWSASTISKPSLEAPE